VLCDEADYAWAKQQLWAYKLNERCPVLFAPVQGKLEAGQLADWILRDNLPVRLQIQLHKYLWSEERGR